MQLCTEIWTFKWNLAYCTTEQYFLVLPLFIILYKVVLTFESVDEILKCDHSYESYWVLSCGAVYYAEQGGSNFWVCGWSPKVWPFWLFKLMNAIEQYFPVVLFIMLYKVIRTFESVYEILKCDHSNESYWAVLFCGAVYYAQENWCSLVMLYKVVLTFESVAESVVELLIVSIQIKSL